MRTPLMLVACALVAGCAGRMPAPSPPPAAAPTPGVVTPPAATRSERLQGAALDSLPSPEAVAVLATIPEPAARSTGPQQSAPAPAPVVSTGDTLRSAAAPEAAYDTLRTAVPGDPGEASASVPVPTPTTPMGDRPGEAASATEVVAPSPVPAEARPVTQEAPTAARPNAVAAAGDTCWRVQVAAPAERAKGERTREAAESLLLVTFVVDREAGLHKVRTRECLTRAAAESLRQRATASGFRGVFLVRYARGR